MLGTEEYYKGDVKDIIISIPTNTIAMEVGVKIYENDKIKELTQTFSVEDINKAEDIYNMCCDGEYPIYTLTEKGKKMFSE